MTKGIRGNAKFLAAIFCCAMLLTSCVTKSRVPDNVELIREDERRVAALDSYRFTVARERDEVLVDLWQEATFEKFALYRVQEIERRRWPRMAGGWYFMMDVFLLKYLTPLGFGVYLVEQHFEHAKGVFLVLLPLTAFTYPVIVFVGGTVAGLFLYSPINILYTPFGVSHRGMVTDFYDSKSEGFREDIGYLPRIGDTALSWLPFYPGFTDRFGERDKVLSEREEERDKSRVTRFEPVTSIDATSGLELEAGAAGAFRLMPRDGRVALPPGVLDHFTEDDSIEFRLRRGEQVLATVSTPGSDLGVTGLVPRRLPATPPNVTLTARALDERRDGAWKAGETIHLLIDVANEGSTRAYNLQYTLNSTAEPESRTVRLSTTPTESPQLTQLGRPVLLAVRLSPGEHLRVVETLTFPSDIEQLELLLGEGPSRVLETLTLTPIGR